MPLGFWALLWDSSFLEIKSEKNIFVYSVIGACKDEQLRRFFCGRVNFFVLAINKKGAYQYQSEFYKSIYAFPKNSNNTFYFIQLSKEWHGTMHNRFYCKVECFICMQADIFRTVMWPVSSNVSTFLFENSQLCPLVIFLYFS